MKKRGVIWLGVGTVSLLAIGVLIPDSPIFLSKLIYRSGQHEGRSASYWIKALDSPDVAARRKAIFALGAIGSEAGEAVPRLAVIMSEDDDRESRIEAALALSKMAPASRQAVPALAQALTDKEMFVRMNAALALSRLKGEAKPAVPALIKAVEDRENQTNLNTFTFTIQEVVALALGRASAGTDEGVAALMAALDKAPTNRVRLAVVRGLGEVGPEARPAADRLRALLTDDDKELKQAVMEALEKMGVDVAGGGVPPADEQAHAGGRSDDLQLAEAERSYLWEIEHHGNLLSKHGFGPLAEALRNADVAALSRLLADDFAGTDLGSPQRVVAAADFAAVERLQDAGHPPTPLSRDAFVARLLEFRKVFTSVPPKVKLALMTLSPKVRGQLDGAWEGTAQLRLHGEHAPGAPAEVVVLLRYEVPRPTAETLARPGWLRAAGVLQAHQAKAPRYLFAEVARQRGFNTAKLHDNWTASSFHPATGGAYVCDFDRDGILDVLITDMSGSRLYQGRLDGTFQDVTARVVERRPGARPLTQGAVAAWVDIDGDGWEDLFLAGRVYRNEQGKRLADHTDRCHLPVPSDTGNVIVADYDGDGRLDLYVTRSGRPGARSWLEGTTAEVKGNYLFRNKGDWQFEDVTEASGTGGGRRSTFTAAWLDANNDGRPDLHVPNEFGDGVLLVNKGNGTFAEHPLADRPADFGTMGLAVGDVDNDGNIDLYCANMYSKAGTRVIGNLPPDVYPSDVMEKMRRFVAGSQLHLNRGGLKFQQAGQLRQVAAVGWAYGPCLADLDNDGWLDIYATAGYVSRNRDELDG